MFQGIGIGVQLAAEEGDMLGLRLGGHGNHHTVGAIVEINHSIDLTPQETAHVMTRQAEGQRLDPFFGYADNARGEGGVEVGGGVTGELSFHQAVDGAKDGWKGCSRAFYAVEVFEVETARAFIPQKG